MLIYQRLLLSHKITSDLWVFQATVKPLQDFVPTTSSAFIATENRPFAQKETILFQPSIFRSELLVSGRVCSGKK